MSQAQRCPPQSAGLSVAGYAISCLSIPVAMVPPPGVVQGPSQRWHLWWKAWGGLCLCPHLTRGNYDDKEVTCRKKSPPGGSPYHSISFSCSSLTPTPLVLQLTTSVPHRPVELQIDASHPPTVPRPKHSFLPLEIPTADKLVYSCEWEWPS